MEQKPVKIKMSRKAKVLVICGIFVSLLYAIVFPFFLCVLTMFFVPTKPSHYMISFGIGVLFSPIIFSFCLFLVFKFIKPDVILKIRTREYVWKSVSPLLFLIVVILLVPRFDHRTPLMKAAARGDIQKVNMISQTDRFDIYEYTVYKGFNTNAMMQAIENNQAEVVKLLLNKDEEISERMDLNLEDAVRSGNYDIVNIFIEAGAFEYTEEKGASAVATACYQGNVEMAQFLIKSGAKDSFIREHGCIKWEEMLAKRGSECECKEGKTGQDGNCVEAGADE